MADIRQYAGRRPRIDDPVKRAAYLMDMLNSEMVYPPGTADWDQKDRQVLLNEETVDYLYTAFTPLTLSYIPGSRPVLERIVNRIIKPGMTERERVLAIIKYCHHDFRDEWPSVLPKDVMVLNASEEELLKLNGGQCEDRSRLLCCLCQVAGIPARFLASYIRYLPEENYRTASGHALVEIYLEGGWAFFDSLRDWWCYRDDGRVASFWDYIVNPDIIKNHADTNPVFENCDVKPDVWTWFHDTFLNPASVLSITNYSASDYWRYDWKWKLSGKDAEDFQRRQKIKKENRRKLLAEIGVNVEKL